MEWHPKHVYHVDMIHTQKTVNESDWGPISSINLGLDELNQNEGHL